MGETKAAETLSSGCWRGLGSLMAGAWIPNRAVGAGQPQGPDPKGHRPWELEWLLPAWASHLGRSPWQIQ